MSSPCPATTQAQAPLRQLDGILILDKPSGPTSAGCLSRIKRLGQRKIGHAGTLDPLARGVLVVLLGQATKVASHLLGGDKTYSGSLRLGLTTDTFDIEGKVTSQADASSVTEADVLREISAWVGESEQEVPAFSAAKHEGKPLYALARKGDETPVKTKLVTVFNAEVLGMDLPDVHFRVRVSSGTYIRSLVHSLGKRLGPGAIMTALTREASHPFGLDQAASLDEILAEPALLASKVLPLEAALPHWPRVLLSPEETALVKNGAWLPVRTLDPGAATPGRQGDCALLAGSDGTPLALAEAKDRDGRLRWAILRGLWR